jgi:hypothetical protein
MFLDPDALQEVSYSYEEATLDLLLMVAVKELDQRALPIQLENLTTAAFRLFPRRFHLRGFPEWPDSLLIYRTLERCRTDKRWLTGTMKSQFHLTETGRAISQSLGPESLSSKHKMVSARTVDAYSAALVGEFRANRVFRNWVRTGRIDEHLTEYLLALHCTSSSHCRVQRGRYDDLYAAALALDDKQVLACLQEMQLQFPESFSG